MLALQASRISLTFRRLFTSVGLVHLQSVTTSIFRLDLVSLALVKVSCTRYVLDRSPYPDDDHRLCLSVAKTKMSTTQTSSSFFFTTVHKLSLAFLSSSPFTTLSCQWYKNISTFVRVFNSKTFSYQHSLH